jgi:glutamyl-tRNA reductase
MSLYAIGINHRTAPVQIREQVVFPPEAVADALGQLQGLGLSEAAILSTCNRTEIYCELDGPGQREALARWLGAYHALDYRELTPYLYVHEDELAVRHALRVACGLDSMVLGEPQILGQLKQAFQAAGTAGSLGRNLGRLFQHAFNVAKRVRTDTAIGASPVSVAFAAVNLAKQIFGDLAEQTALLIGAGETIELAARHLHGSGVRRMIIANRSLDRGALLAGQFGAEAIPLPEIPRRLAEADIVISSTAAPLPILGKGAVERAIRARKHRPMFMVDIAVPRDIEPEVAELDDVYLYTVDDLETVIEENLRTRREAADQAEELIDVQVQTFMGWLRAQGAIGTIRAYRDRADATRREVLDRALRMLAQGRPAEEALSYLAHTLTNKLIHDPTSALNEAAHEGRKDLLEAAEALLRLQEDLRIERKRRA